MQVPIISPKIDTFLRNSSYIFLFLKVLPCRETQVCMSWKKKRTNLGDSSLWWFVCSPSVFSCSCPCRCPTASRWSWPLLWLLLGSRIWGPAHQSCLLPQCWSPTHCSRTPNRVPEETPKHWHPNQSVCVCVCVRYWHPSPLGQWRRNCHLRRLRSKKQPY